MIAMIFYLVVCVAVAVVMTFLYVMMRPIRARDELRSWRVAIALTIFVVFIPYGVIELETYLFGEKMKDAVESAMSDAGIDGKTLYYKVLVYQGEKARVLAIGEEKQSWGGMDHPAVKITLVKKDRQWVADSYNIVYSENRNLDGVVFPPYW